MTADTSMPPTMFDLEDAPADAKPHPTQAQLHVLAPADLEPTAFCADSHYGSLMESAGQRVWVVHVCTRKRGHTVDHKCDRCEATW